MGATPLVGHSSRAAKRSPSPFGIARRGTTTTHQQAKLAPPPNVHTPLVGSTSRARQKKSVTLRVPAARDHNHPPASPLDAVTHVASAAGGFNFPRQPYIERHPTTYRDAGLIQL